MTTKTRRCVRCKEEDTTDFSSCRFCGTKYDAVIQQAKAPGANFGSMLRSWPTLILFLIIAVLVKGPVLRTITYVVSGGQTTDQLVENSLRHGGR